MMQAKFNQNHNYQAGNSESEFHIEQKIGGTNSVFIESYSETPIQCNSDSDFTLNVG
jgi:hypothetical protein